MERHKNSWNQQNIQSTSIFYFIFHFNLWILIKRHRHIDSRLDIWKSKDRKIKSKVFYMWDARNSIKKSAKSQISKSIRLNSFQRRQITNEKQRDFHRKTTNKQKRHFPLENRPKMFFLLFFNAFFCLSTMLWKEEENYYIFSFHNEIPFFATPTTNNKSL